MTPQEFNALVSRIVVVLNGAPGIESASEGMLADDDGTLPEIYCAVEGVDLCLTVAPL